MIIKPELQENIKVLNKIILKEFQRKELGRDYNFEEATEKFKQIRDDLNVVIDNADLLRIPESLSERIAGFAENLKGHSQKIKDFILKNNPNAQQEYNQLNGEIDGLYQDALDFLTPLVERVNFLSIKPSEIKNKLVEASRSAQDIEEIKGEAQKTKDEVEKAAKEIRGAFGESGALTSVKSFEEQAKKHRKLANQWFLGFVGSIIFTVIIVIFLFTEGFGFVPSLSLSDLKLKDDWGPIIQMSIFKLVLLSIAYLLVYQSIKNYKINCHLYVLNLHRQLTLSTYPLMAKATDNQEQSNLIVGQAAKAIFEPGTTGYLNGDDNPNPINLTEVITKIADKK